MMVQIAGMIALGVVTSPADSARRTSTPDWLDHTQTYCMVPLLPETAAKLHASVNGVWGGIGGAHPIISHRDTVPEVAQRYGVDGSRFTEESRRAGMIPCGIINGLEGFPTLRATTPDLEEMACRNAAGNPLKVGDGMLLMCVNNPKWVDWELRQGELAIRQGAECVQIDTPMSASFIAGILRGGFCDPCLEGFRRWLERRYSATLRRDRFRLASLETRDLIPRLSPLQNVADPDRRPFHNSSPDDPLFREFIRYQEQSGFDSRKKLVEALRRFARTQGRQVAFTANAADLGTVNPGGHWIRGLMFADLFDLFAYELNPEPLGLNSPQATPYPRGKWAPYHRLAYAVYGRRSPAAIHAGPMGSLLLQAISGKSINAWMEVQSAEAYAANGAYIQYHVAPTAAKGVMLERCWKGAARHAAFVQSHRELFDGELQSGSDLAILFLMNERGRTVPSVFPSYLGFAQAWTEASVPFDVVFGGDGHYVRDRLAASALRPYRKLLIPSPIAPTRNQCRVVQNFVRNGGTVICQEPERLGLRLAPETAASTPAAVVKSRHRIGRGQVWVLQGSLSDTWTGDAGADFFRSYRPELRSRIVELAEALDVHPLVVPGGAIAAFPLSQPKSRRLIVHLVNYDVDREQDRVVDTRVSLTIPRLSYLDRRLRATLHTGDVATAVTMKNESSQMKLEVARLGAYGTLVIEADSTR